MLSILWCDTETTGLETSDSAPFQIAFLYEVTDDKQIKEVSKIFYLNPLNETILYHEEAGKVHGYTKEQIESFDAPSKVIPEIIEWLNNQNTINQLPYFCGYNSKFDYNHLSKLFADYGYNFDDCIQTKRYDVFEQVKEAGFKRVLPYLENRKLTTIAKHLGVTMDNAHDAMCDITATQEVARILQKSGINLLK